MKLPDAKFLGDTMPADRDVQPVEADDFGGFDDFYDMYAKKCVLYVRSLRVPSWWWNSMQTPEDIVQEAFLVALRKWDEVSHMKFRYAYVREVARNLVRRSMDRVYESPMDMDADLLPDMVDWGSLGDAVGDEVVELAKELPLRQGQILILDSYGFTDREIGWTLGLATATVRSHRRHMQHHVRERMLG